MAPRAVGIGLRAPHYAALLERDHHGVDFVEVHSENFFGDGGEPHAWLERHRARRALSLHGVGLSLGSWDPLDARHLDRLARLVRRYEPALVSEHLSWSSIDGRFANDLLPLPFTAEALDHVVRRIDEVQERLRRRILVENVSTYWAFPHAEMDEAAFLDEAARRSGCGILLDVNNVWVNAANHRFDALAYLGAIDPRRVEEFHLAGFERSGELLIDTHARAVSADVWDLYARSVERFGPRPTIVEWDADIPALDVLLREAMRARKIAKRPDIAVHDEA
ncbi:MAG: DUF692 domain-containing protein [Bacillota bacterium]